VGQLDLFSSEQVAAIQAELVSLNTAIQSLDEKVAQLGTQADWRKNVQRLEAELVELEKERATLERELEEFSPQRERLKKAVIAAELDSEATRLSLLRDDYAKRKESLQADESSFPELEKSCQTLGEVATNAAGKRILAQTSCTEFEPQKAEIESLDRKIKVALDTAASIGSELQALEKTIAEESTKQKEEQGKQKEIERKAKGLEKYFKDNAADEWLVDGLSGLEIQLGQLLTSQKNIGEQEKEIEVKRSKVQALEREQESLQREQQAATKHAEATSKSLRETETRLQDLLAGKTIFDLRKELGELHRKREHANLVASFEEHRTRLHQGEACPLCGALEHPFAADGIATTSQLEGEINATEELISKAEKLELEIRAGGDKQSQAERALSEVRTRATVQVRLVESEVSSLASIEGAIERTRQQRVELESVLAVRLRPLGVELNPSTNADELQRTLIARQRAWKERKEQAGTLTTEMNQVRETLVAARVRMEGWEVQRLGLVERKDRNQEELQREIGSR
ncbi:MAG: hypothetical protein ACKO0N_07325, partial [Planctomycetota bacterium]